MMIEVLLATVPFYVYDGDTISLTKQPPSFRLVGLDTPEIAGKCEAEKRLARLARNRLRALIASDPEAKLTEVLCYGSNFGRRCGVIKVKGVDVAITLVREQYADPFSCGSKGCPKRRDWCQTVSTPR
jgi:endonuclease YncB( thermonuclease family)